MDPDLVAALVGGGAGLLGATVGISVPLLMLRGNFSRWTATRPRPGVAPVSREALIQRILALNDASQPYSYRPGDKYDVRAEWRIADASWWGVFQRNHLTETYLAKICLNDRFRELRILEERGRLEWAAGLYGGAPRVVWNRQFFRGIVLFEKSREIAYGIRELAPMDWGRVIDYDFDVRRIKGPILRAAVESGWTYCPVVLERHLTADRPLAG